MLEQAADCMEIDNADDRGGRVATSAGNEKCTNANRNAMGKQRVASQLPTPTVEAVALAAAACACVGGQRGEVRRARVRGHIQHDVFSSENDRVPEIMPFQAFRGWAQHFKEYVPRIIIFPGTTY